MQNDRRLTRAIRFLIAAGGVIAFLGLYTIAFAKETLHTSDIPQSHNTFGR